VTQSTQQILTHRRVWALAGPIILSNISVPLVGAVDTAVVGHLPEPDSIGAVALGALIFTFLFWGFGFLRMGTTGFIARAYGANDEQALSDTLLRVLMLATTLGLVIIALGYPLIHFALYLLDSSDNIESLASSYAMIRIWSAPATLSIYVFTGVFIGLHNMRYVFVLQLVMNSVNVLLDLLFVLVFDMGVEGVALATLIAEYLAVFLGFWLLRKPLAKAYRQLSWARLLERSAILALMKANGDIFVRTLCLVFSFGYFTAKSASMGDVILAANAILMHLQSILAYALDGFAHAAEALVGSAYGGGKQAQFKRAIKLTTIWGLVCALLISLVFWLFGGFILQWFTSIDAVLITATKYYPWTIIAPIVAIWSFQLDGIFIGTGYTREMRNAMIVSMLMYFGLLAILVPMLGNHGLFFSLTLFMILRALTLCYYYPSIVKGMDHKKSY
jgi:MATE family multidrug resistance protein|tara:strand:- start:100 stop:1437 length:1338 start_codon:yes stop_codon:yes gene_type:complete